MIAGRLRECLRLLTWEAADLAQELDCPRNDVTRWLEGRAPVPLAVAAWIEALAKRVQTMNHDRFEEPVTNLVGMGLPVRLETVMQAYALLQDWPAAIRSSAHAIALDACKAGIACETRKRSARPLLPSPVDDILAPDMVSLAPTDLAEHAPTSNNC
ncbi:DUF982 domain-containing protein [Mesorhizobium sp. VK9D]|uniref:DUF982 domain-containing protein n=1 Tax=Mesorhizobium australafricanum TaxID=3072311 RepID=UPI002A2401CB|nr:DUF982 domain-containing protein [Mesorhizobium sp. VK9D]MDX8454570.1 DUF982 domain-containing protein [Mesorhizobium sp. VK9D]